MKNSSMNPIYGKKPHYPELPGGEVWGFLSHYYEVVCVDNMIESSPVVYAKVVLQRRERKELQVEL